MKRIIRFGAVTMTLLACSAFAGGDHDDAGHEDHGSADEVPVAVVTEWSSQMGLFMEHPLLLRDQPTRFVIHLTVLDDFQPVREGNVTLRFSDSEGEAFEFSGKELLRDGIFTPTVKLGHPGIYELSLHYEGSNLGEIFHLGEIIVHRTVGEIPVREVDEPTDDISFLMEQQWKVPFAAAEAEVREIKRAIWAIGEVLPSPKAYAEIVAPVDGVVQAAYDADLALPGSIVERGDVLVAISPPAQIDGWTASRLGFEQVERDFERAKRLREHEAISQREFEQARTDFLSRKAGLDVLSGENNTPSLVLRAPIAGQIIEWQVRPGQRVAAGDKLMAVVDPKVVWLKVNVYENDFRTLGHPVGAFINKGGVSGGWTIPAESMRVLTKGGALDPATRTIPVLIEVDNSAGYLSVHESNPVELYASDGALAVAVPRSAVYKDNGLDAVFVQTGGESFEKRQVTVGPHYAGWASILDGLLPGERVVTLGGYQVKLASSTAEIGHGHAH